MALVGHVTTDTKNTAILTDFVKADVAIMTELVGGLSTIATSAASGLIVLSEGQGEVLQKIKSNVMQVGTVYAATLRVHSYLDNEISSRLSALSALLDQRICMWEDMVRNHGTVIDGGRAVCTLSLSGWVAHMSHWVEDTKKALNDFVLKQHTEFTILEKQIKGLNDHYVRETGSEYDQPQRILFALENSFLNADHALVYPKIRPTPLYFSSFEYETWPEEERSVAVEGAKILDACLKAGSLTD